MTLETLLITYTDPKFLLAAAAAVVLVGYVIFTLRQPSGSPTQTGDAPANELDQQASAAPPAGAEAGSTGQAAPIAEEPKKSKLTPGKGRTLAEMVGSEEIADASLLSRFVLNAQGDTMGETMALDNDEVILKTGDGFAAVSQEAIIEKDGMLLVDANIDWEAAHEAGEAWKQASMDEMEYDESGMPVKDD